MQAFDKKTEGNGYEHQRKIGYIGHDDVVRQQDMNGVRIRNFPEPDLNGKEPQHQQALVHLRIFSVVNSHVSLFVLCAVDMFLIIQEIRARGWSRRVKINVSCIVLCFFSGSKFSAFVRSANAVLLFNPVSWSWKALLSSFFACMPMAIKAFASLMEYSPSTTL